MSVNNFRVSLNEAKVGKNDGLWFLRWLRTTDSFVCTPLFHCNAS